MATMYVRDLPQNQGAKRFSFAEYDRWNAGLCMHCGEAMPCACRWCDSCSDFWVAAEPKEYDEGHVVWELCPDCKEEG